MGMRGAQDQRPDFRQIEPVRKLPPDHAAGFAAAAPGHHLNATDLIGMSTAQELLQRVEGPLRRHPMQVQGPRGDQLAGLEPMPRRLVDTPRLGSHG